MLYGIAALLFVVFIIGSFQNNKDYEDSKHYQRELEENKYLQAEIDHLQNQLDMPEHRRMEISESDLNRIRTNLTNSRKRVKILESQNRELVKLLRTGNVKGAINDCKV